MFFEFLNAVITLDLKWLADTVFLNLHYLFVFFALSYLFWDRKFKKAVFATLLFCLVAWAWGDFENVFGWFLFAGGFLSIYYVTKLVVLTFAENIPELKNNLVLVSELQFLLLFAAYNLFLR